MGLPKLHSPNSRRQLRWPQYALVLPQKPYLLQQLPRLEPKHDLRTSGPHRPSVVTVMGAVLGVVHEPNSGLQPLLQNLGLLPQRPNRLQQSPKREPRQVTPLPQNPFLEILSGGGTGDGEGSVDGEALFDGTGAVVGTVVGEATTELTGTLVETMGVAADDP